MSDDLDLVRSIFAPWDGGDYRSNEWADPDIEFVIADGPEPGRWSGLVEMANGWRNFLGTWEGGYRAVTEEFRELDGERVLVTNSYSGRAKTSGMDVGQFGAKGATLLHIRAGKVTRLVLYWDRENALADLGLAE
jgi:ketosteroid isomerase-like protein